ncbi:MAG: hypothetical protein J6K74_00280 [Marinifilaceae bacterium]|nr:hypothetical protein [Marinifilaceae bacterium]
MERKKNKQVQLFCRDFYGKIGKAVHDFNLIRPDDNILVGVSGGVDSLALLVTLAERAKSSKIPYKVYAAHIRSTVAEYETDTSYLQHLCDSLGVELILDTISAQVDPDSNKPMCFVCAWNRRKKLFQIAKRINCTKLALGHHRDDAITTLLMGMFFNGNMSSMPAQLPMFDGELTIIRPLIYIGKDEITQFATIRGFKEQVKRCKFESSTNRNRVEELIKQIESYAPEVRDSLFASMGNIKYDYLPVKMKVTEK